MRKYLCVASLFALNAEVISWLALLIIVFMGVADFCIAAEKEKEKR